MAGDPICRHGIYLTLCGKCRDQHMEETFKPLIYGDRRKSCPCEFDGVLACRSSCSCKWPMFSGGCDRCCKYGSEAQQLAAARDIAERERRLRELEDVYRTATELASQLVKHRRPRRRRRRESE
jgi:hypothetical protein